MKHRQVKEADQQISFQEFSISARTYYTALVIISALSLWLRTGVPITAVPFSTYDDQLFFRTAKYLVEGQWLGPYDNLTLVKGMFYPFFVALAFWASIP